MLNHLEEDQEILQEFINESTEALDDIEELLIELESDISQLEAVDSDTINKIFRVFHSIKGSAGFIGLKLTGTVTHQAETLLDLIRKGKISLRKEHIDIFLELCDFFQSLLNHIQETFSESGFEDAGDQFCSRLQELMAEVESENPQAPPVPKKPKTKASPKKEKEKSTRSKTDKEPVKTSAKGTREGEEKGRVEDELITPEMVQQFISEARELLDALEQDLLKLEQNPTDQDLAEKAFRSLHSLKGNAGFLGYSDIGAVCHKAESFLEGVRSGVRLAEEAQISIILQVLDFLREAVDNLEAGNPPVISGLPGVLDLMSDFFGEAPATDTGETGEAVMAESVEDLPKDAPVSAAVRTEPPDSTGNVSPAEKPAISIDLTKKPKANGKAAANEVIRVGVNKLNHLMNLVGEIVIAESMVAQHPALTGQELEGLEKALGYLQKNVRELQELATSMRMVPLTGVFRKMLRLMRDLSKKNHKKAELAMHGGETEVDRSVIEHISDPLVHVIRNSMDHGLEPPEERRAAGKPETGQLSLEAKRVGGEIWIEVKDDGRGLNRKKILARARERGLIEGDGADLSDEKVWNLIFAPGFSTADKVTDISGRGVGMDVVVKNIEKIRGRVEIRSVEGQGTTLVMRIPLTTAIIDGMLMKIGHSIYAIPTLDIKESLQVSKSQIVDLIDGQEVVKIRDKLVPVLRLMEVHGLQGEQKQLDEGILVVAENGEDLVGFFVDELIGQHQLVIKPLPDYVGDVEGVSGCAILGNGEICMILDTATLIKMAETIQLDREVLYAG